MYLFIIYMVNIVYNIQIKILTQDIINYYMLLGTLFFIFLFESRNRVGHVLAFLPPGLY